MGRGRGKYLNKREIRWYEQGGLCFFCGIPMAWRDFKDGENPDPCDATIDHLDERPQINRGSFRSGYRIVLSCSRCNSRRGFEFYENRMQYRHLSHFYDFNSEHLQFLTTELD